MRITFPFIKEIKKPQLIPIWRRYSKKRMPKIRVFIVSNRQFNKTLRIVVKKFKRTDVKEYGKKVPNKGVVAFTFRPKSEHVVVIQRKRPREFTQKKVISHEIRHIAKGDLK